ncbi:MAG TPA: aldose epimerase family protein [Phycisphaerae bacterium]|nr:aldose epimerase family protein [Phycisphaerae bacterium]
MADQNNHLVHPVSRRTFLAAAGAAATWSLLGCQQPQPPAFVDFPRKIAVYSIYFGTLPTGENITQYTLTNSQGMVVQLISYGARIQRIRVPDGNGQIGDVVLGFTQIDSYALPTARYYGATIGRYANRIAGGKFTLDGVTYKLPINEPELNNTLHGGPNAFDRKVWLSTSIQQLDLPGVRFNYFSPAFENGFPGNLEVSVTYLLNDYNELHVLYRATTDAPTVVNLTNHSYFNLLGPGNSVMDHTLMVNAGNYTPTNDDLIPKGDIVRVDGTPFDLRTPVRIGDRIQGYPSDPNANPHLFPYGYDDNWCINGWNGGKQMALATRISEPTAGRQMEIWTTQPGIQVATGNFLDGSLTGLGGPYNYHGAITLEPQHYPNSPNQPNFPSTVLNPGPSYFQENVYRFSTL